ncbi:penicillin-binding protein 1A [Spirochaeta cellobiosiphila]|uniref:penicillin-binding protein 1A n=1 Tax=Spirochaeta cellobiosiphila TaxID=504483 RepID=UPI0004187378|nr:PBP1A family penicillin-binding protein [Spirochaeta cellobiosiphila]
MTFTGKKRILFISFFSVTIFSAIFIGSLLGWALGSSQNIQNSEKFGQSNPALPTQILDINGNLITEFFSDEKREIVPITQLPDNLVKSLVTREDQNFFKHSGFDIMGFSRALANIILGRYVSGGSTLSQQLAGNMYADRTKLTITRKVRELWWAFQLERKLSKWEILENYVNKMYFGHSTYGVEAASQFFFKHSARSLSLAESAMLVIQLVRPELYSPIKRPNSAKKIQHILLEQTVAAGLYSQEYVDQSFEEYWTNYDWQRDSTATAFFEREDQSPYFSEYIRGELDNIIYGAQDIYKDGYIVHTTLNLDYQRQAEEIMSRRIKEVNNQYQRETFHKMDFVNDEYVPIVDLLSLVYNINDIRVAGAKNKAKARQHFKEDLTPTLDILATVFGMTDIKDVAIRSVYQSRQDSKKNEVEGALITLDNRTGYILAMVGGSKFDTLNQFNRAVQGKMQPGSSFKPLYYSAAISSRKYTPATRIEDKPIVFYNDDGSWYTPLNYKGEWEGSVLLRQALAHSMNVPAVQVLDGIGFDAAINRASRMLGITDPEEIARVFPRKYPLALGVISVSPLQMARAYATFPNQGMEVDPLSIRYVEDREGNIIVSPEKELREQQKSRGKSLQIMTPQEAYIMVSILKTTVKEGTLRWATHDYLTYPYYKGYKTGLPMPMAGKTGTTQNWSAAWTVGFSPYVTTAIWFGFDKSGSSLGLYLTGATAAGPTWAEYMRSIHQELEPVDFPRPENGLVEVNIDSETGMRPTEYSKGKVIKEIFLSGTEPRANSQDIAKYEHDRDDDLIESMKQGISAQILPLDDLDLNITTNLDDNYSSNDLDYALDLDFDFDSDSSSSADQEEPINSLLD